MENNIELLYRYKEVLESIDKKIELMGANKKNIKSNLGNVTANYRHELSWSEKAIEIGETYLKIYGDEILSEELCNSMAGAYMDLEDCANAKIWLERAGAIGDITSPHHRNTCLRYEILCEKR